MQKQAVAGDLVGSLERPAQVAMLNQLRHLSVRLLVDEHLFKSHLGVLVCVDPLDLFCLLDSKHFNY